MTEVQEAVDLLVADQRLHLVVAEAITLLAKTIVVSVTMIGATETALEVQTIETAK